MINLNDKLITGDIILLWFVGFGTFTTESWFPKYFKYTYGINAPKNLSKLVKEGFIEIESAFASLKHINSIMKKNILRQKAIKGLSKLKAAELDEVLKENSSEKLLILEDMH